MTFCLFSFYILFPNILVMKIVFPGKQGQEKMSNARGMPGKGGGGGCLSFDLTGT